MEVYYRERHKIDIEKLRIATEIKVAKDAVLEWENK
jgi:hypothetical protein